MRTTPVGPVRVLAAQLVANFVIALVAMALFLAGGRAGVRGRTAARTRSGSRWPGCSPPPRCCRSGCWSPRWCRRGRRPPAIGTLLFFPMMFFAGLWVPIAADAAAVAGHRRVHPARRRHGGASRTPTWAAFLLAAAGHPGGPTRRSARSSPSAGSAGRRTCRFCWVAVVPFTLIAGLAGFMAVAGYPAADLGLCGVAAAWMLPALPLAREGVLLRRAAGDRRRHGVAEPGVRACSPRFRYIYAFTMLRWPWRLGRSRPDGGGVGAGARRRSAPRRAAAGGHRRGQRRHDGHDRLGAARRRPGAASSGSRPWPGWRPALAGERRPARPAPRPGPRGGRARRAPADGREIHDTLAQGLTGIITQLQAAEQLHEVPDPWRRPFERGEGPGPGQPQRGPPLGRRPAAGPALETARLSEALADVSERWSALQGIPVQGHHHRHGPAARPRHRVRAAAHRPGGAGQRGQARRGDAGGVTLSLSGGEVALDVRDDGKGFDLSRSPAADSDWPSCASASRGWRGSLRVESEIGGGTGISACRPLEARMIRSLLIADDHPIVRDGLSAMFAAAPGFEVVGEAARRRRGGCGSAADAAARRDPARPAHAGHGRPDRDHRAHPAGRDARRSWC